MLVLQHAEARDHPTHLENFLEPGTLAGCQAGVAGVDLLARRAMAQTRLAVYSETNDNIVYPHSQVEWDTLIAGQEHQGFAINDVDCDSAAINGLRLVLARMFWPRPLTVGGYFSALGDSVYPIHEDVDHVLAFQLRGRRRFDFYAEQESKPASVTIAPGDGLFIPRRTLHRAQTVSDDMSVHLCTTILDSWADKITAHQALVEAQHRPDATFIKGLIEPRTLAACQSSLSIEDLIATSLRHDTLRVYHDDQMISPADRRHFDDLIARKGELSFLAGSVAVCSEAIGELKKTLDAVFAPMSVGFGLYVSSAGGAVLPLHTDREQVVAIQIDAQKEIELIGSDDQKRTVKLDPGDALFIPAGIWHRTRALSGTSLQLCGIVQEPG